jgi:hypothetical protein
MNEALFQRRRATPKPGETSSGEPTRSLSLISASFLLISQHLKSPDNMLIIILVLLLIFGGGFGGYYGYNRYGREAVSALSVS